LTRWEIEIGPLVPALFALFFLIFVFTRKRWARSVALATSLIVLNSVWLVSAAIYLGARKLLFLEGLPFGVAYLFIIFGSPLVAATGALEGVVIIYHLSSIKTAWPTVALRRHCVAFLSAAFCFCAYLIARHLTVR
jgi:hypothetical protein